MSHCTFCSETILLLHNDDDGDNDDDNAVFTLLYFTFTVDAVRHR